MRTTSTTRSDRGTAVRGVVRQGDVLLVPVRSVPLDGAGVVAGNVVAQGEATGHAHVVHGPARVLSTRASGADELFVVVDRSGASLRHEEHDAIPLARGTYRVVRQREYEPRRSRASLGWRRVAD